MGIAIFSFGSKSARGEPVAVQEALVQFQHLCGGEGDDGTCLRIIALVAEGGAPRSFCLPVCMPCGAKFSQPALWATLAGSKSIIEMREPQGFFQRVDCSTRCFPW